MLTKEDINFRSEWDFETMGMKFKAFYKGKHSGILCGWTTEPTQSQLETIEELAFKAIVRSFERHENSSSN